MSDTIQGPTAMAANPTSKQPWRHPQDHPLRRFISHNRASLGSLVVLVVMMAIFIAANPTVFTSWTLYASVFTTLPVAIFLTVPLVFIVTVGEIDLSFPATMGFAAWMFALLVQAGFPPIVGLVAAVITGAALGAFVGALVVYLNLSSLIATLGMNFVVRGVILIFTEGKLISLSSLGDTWLYAAFSSDIFGLPVQMLWAIAFTIFAVYLYGRHRFGAHVHIVGDNPDSAAQMGINVKMVRVQSFIFVGVGAALAGVFSTMINFTWWPTAGDGYLLPVLASVFVGGTPTWGGIGTVVGGAIGATTVSFIQTGIVGVGLSGFYVQFFNGLIIILSLVGHRWNQIRYR
ncbi:MAG: ABC transporter permease [Ancalomicrobiaceae bacterium]|nr:ABC transporter permease [Ancalomicrobiaceae bacterium]